MAVRASQTPECISTSAVCRFCQLLPHTSSAPVTGSSAHCSFQHSLQVFGGGLKLLGVRFGAEES